MILCDPPYGITQNPWDVIINIEMMWQELKRVRKDNTAIALFSMLPFTIDLIGANRKEFRYEWIWHETNPVGFLNANRMPLRAHENILVFYKRLPVYNPQKTKGKPYKKGDAKGTTSYRDGIEQGKRRYDGNRMPVDVFKCKNNDTNFTGKLHPTQRPVGLLSYLIKTYTNEGMTVLDFAMGSGSTGVACIEEGRHFIGIEQDDYYFEVAKKRIDEAMLEKENKK